LVQRNDVDAVARSLWWRLQEGPNSHGIGRSIAGRRRRRQAPRCSPARPPRRRHHRGPFVLAVDGVHRRWEEAAGKGARRLGCDGGANYYGSGGGAVRGYHSPWGMGDSTGPGGGGVPTAEAEWAGRSMDGMIGIFFWEMHTGCRCSEMLFGVLNFTENPPNTLLQGYI
jgi:hypothetical protein